jgi:ABC-type Fe3+-hydroxamate transport system substrate-binding protein
MIARSRIFILIGVSILSLGGTIALSGCTRGTNLNVVNRSTSELTNVVATGSGFTRSISSIPAGAQRSVSISPRSESALRLDFDAKGKHFKSLPQGYFENGTHTKVTATVSPDFTVSVDMY